MPTDTTNKAASQTDQSWGLAQEQAFPSWEPQKLHKNHYTYAKTLLYFKQKLLQSLKQACNLLKRAQETVRVQSQHTIIHHTNKNNFRIQKLFE